MYASAGPAPSPKRVALALALACLAPRLAGGCIECDYKNLPVAVGGAFYDGTLRDEVRLEVANVDASLALIVEDYPSQAGGVPLGTGGSVRLDGVNADYSTCGLCLLARRGDTLFAPTGGVAQVQAPAVAGDSFTVTLQGVALQAVDPLGRGGLAADGERWCFADNTRLSFASGHWPCSAADQLVAGASLGEGQNICLSDPGLRAYVLWTCTGGIIVRGADCGAQNQACDPNANASGSASCH